MRIGVALPTVSLDHGRELLLPVAEAAERLGFHSVWATDHVIMPYERSSTYPYAHSGTEIAMTPGMQWIDPLITLATVAGATERVGLGTSVLVLPYRNPVVLANELAGLHLLSGDRLVLGVGAGWMREEFDALGIDTAERGRRTDEAIRVLRTLWTEDPATFQGEFTTFQDIVLATTPRDSRPPIWVGGNSRPALRRALRHGDGWHGFEVFPEDMDAIHARLRELGEEVGRDPGELELSVVRGFLPPGRAEEGFIPGRRSLGATDGGEAASSAAATVEELGRYAEAGVTLVLLQPAMLAPLVPEALEWLAAEILPQLPGPASGG